MSHTEIRFYRDHSDGCPMQDWLDQLEQSNPGIWAKCLQRLRMLSEKGFRLNRPHAASLRDGISELRFKAGTVNYRMLYFFSGKSIVVVSHGLTKEKKVPSGDIDKAIERKTRTNKNLDKFTLEWSV